MKFQSLSLVGRVNFVTRRTPLAALLLFTLLCPSPGLSADVVRDSRVQQIIGGSERLANTPPWMVALIRKADSPETPASRQQFCGGVLVSADWVLTAAHCVLRSTTENMLVILGEGDIDAPDVELRALSEIVVHPGYNPRTFANDVALLKLSESTPQEPLALLVDPLSLNLVGQSATAYGWGQTFINPDRCDPLFADSSVEADEFECRIHDFERSSRDVQSQLLQTNLSLLSKDACNTRVLELLEFLEIDTSAFDTTLDFTPPDQFCAFDPTQKKGVCFGDSGGPLTIMQGDTEYLLGTASLIYGPGGCAREFATDVFTLTASFEAFMEDVMHRDFALSFESFCPPEVDISVEYGDLETSLVNTRVIWSASEDVSKYLVRYSLPFESQSEIFNLALDGSNSELSAALEPGTSFYVTIQAENEFCSGPVSKVLEIEVPQL